MEIKTYLQNLEINFKSFTHPPVFTCEQAEEYNKEIRGIHCKNLFLKNDFNFYLAILPAHKKLDFKILYKLFDNKLKFANEDDLKHILNLTPGAVSPFALVNDKEHKVILIIDKEIWDSDFVSFHPNTNTETLELAGKDFQKYVNSLNCNFKII